MKAFIVLICISFLSYSANRYADKIVLDTCDKVTGQDWGITINSYLASGKKVVLGAGTFTPVDSSIRLQSGYNLHLSNGSELFRDSTSTSPVPMVRITASTAQLTGDGFNSTIQCLQDRRSVNIYKDGIINCGPKDTILTYNLNWWRISGIRIIGPTQIYAQYLALTNTKIDSISAITLVNGADIPPTSAGSNYNGVIENCLISYVGIGVNIRKGVQGMQVINNNFYKISKNAQFSINANENLFNGCFIHSSPGIIGVEADSFSLYSHVYGLIMEPGSDAPNGRESKGFKLDSSSNRWTIIGNFNTGHSVVDSSAIHSHIYNGLIHSTDTIYNP